MRVLGRIRISRLTDESTSPERQKEIITGWCASNGHTVVGWAEDLDVSGAIDPFDTVSLGPWLTDRLGEWDILCAWKLDRLSRRAVPLHRLFGLIQDNDKTLVCVADNIDLSTWVGRLIASVIAGVAEGELEAIKERTKASHAKLRELGRWPGGRPAYGYKAVEREGAAGWQLVEDEAAASVLRSIIGRVLAGDSVESVAAALTAAGEPSPSDYARLRGGNPSRGTPWRGQSIRKLLRSRTLLGFVTHQGVTVRDREGHPILKGPPLITQCEFDRVQSALDDKSFTVRTRGASPLLGIACCFGCGGVLHHRGQTSSGKLYRYYYCRVCRGAQIRAEMVEELVEDAFLSEIGDCFVLEPVFVPAENHQIALNEAVRAVDEISTLLGTITSDTMRSRLTEQMRALDFQIAHLEKLPNREAHWEYNQTEETFAHKWRNSNETERRTLLTRSGITARIKRTPGTQTLQFELIIPADIQTRLNTKNPPK